jgi:hypothetical protein
MNGRTAQFLWIGAAVLATTAGVSAAPWQPENAPALWIIPALIVMWLVTLAGLFLPAARPIISAPARWLRRNAIGFWFLLLVYLAAVLGIWAVNWQPAYNKPVSGSEFCWLFSGLWGLIYLFAFGLTTDHARAMGSQISQSRLAGVLITLTFLLIMFIAGEAWLRRYYVTTDAFSFTSMTYWWYENFYYKNLNSRGFRDAEPQPDSPGLIRIIVTGDSFAAGHGIDDINQIFFQLLEQKLGPGYDVNLVAQSGWDTPESVAKTIEFSFTYPPRAVILSYYLNDIYWMLRDTDQNPNRNFDFAPPGILADFIRDFFLPNFIYYNLIQFTSPVRTGNHLQDLVSAYENPENWARQTAEFDRLIAWGEERGVDVVVLIWPNPADIEGSEVAIRKVGAYFEAAGGPVVYMSDVLRGLPVRDLIVNAFDTHPSVEANRLAAEALYTQLQAMGYGNN